MIIDCVADTHGFFPQLEGGDLLIVAGDLTAGDTPAQVIEFGIWLNNQKYKRKILIAGNHDNMIQTTPRIFEGLPDFVLTYLCDSGTEFEGLKVWGSPWTKTFSGMNPKCKAFTVDTEKELAEKWALIPDDTDILITHSPPFGRRDVVQDYIKGKMESVGSSSLMNSISKLKPTINIFGHIHDGYGKEEQIWWPFLFCEMNGIPKKTIFVNASHVNERYQPVNKPIRIEL